ncbi:hypothetical protein [Amycolatopsis antarctica]|uniref:hypothetical protein n=1 Tax=Amycolatopsis antarctica TaxID=1854586 RepID=UPI001055902C|nr:hypothetical protein [Amycolatopsis antarctica]
MDEPREPSPVDRRRDQRKSACASTAALLLVVLAGFLSAGTSWAIVLCAAAGVLIGVAVVLQWARYLRLRT